jgi:hypothetical protein
MQKQQNRVRRIGALNDHPLSDAIDLDEYPLRQTANDGAAVFVNERCDASGTPCEHKPGQAEKHQKRKSENYCHDLPER